MARKRGKYSSKQKVQMVMEALTYAQGVQAYCRVKGVKDTQIYQWKNKIIENAENAFSDSSKKDQSQIIRMSNELNEKNDVIADLAKENLKLKKKYGD